MFAEWRAGGEHPDDQADERLAQTPGRDVIADISDRLGAFEQPSHRHEQRALVLLRIRTCALAREQHKWISDLDQSTNQASDTLLGVDLVDPCRRQTLIHLLERDPDQLVEQRAT